MNNISTIILTILSLNLFGQDFNSTMNDNINLLRETKKTINSYGILKVELYSNDSLFGKIDVSKSKDKMVDVVRYLVSHSNIHTTSLKLYSNHVSINISSNNIKVDTLNELKTFADYQINHMRKYKIVTHRRGKLSLEDRLKESNITTNGVLMEICSMTSFYEGDDYALSIKILKSYFINRNKTEHWNSLMNHVYKYYETRYNISNDIVYSITVMHSDLTVKTKKGA